MKPFLPLLICLALACPVPGLAQSDRTQTVIARLQAEGFTVTEVRRSWLGRILITAQDGTDLREVVLNRTSGEILRDRVFPGAHDSNGAAEGTAPQDPRAGPAPAPARGDDRGPAPGRGDAGPGPGGGGPGGGPGGPGGKE